MSVIELAGMIGSGKTTIARELIAELERRGATVLGRPEAIERCMERSALGAITRFLPAERLRRRMHVAVYRFVVRPMFALAFAARHRHSTTLAMTSGGVRSLPKWHRKKVLQLFFRTAATTAFLASRLDDDEVMVLEEGLVHRAVNLFAWDAPSVDGDQVLRFLNGLPAVDLIIFVDTPLDACLDRAEARGLPRRLSEKDEATTQRFMANAAAIIDVVGTWLESSSNPTVRVFNGGTPREAIVELTEGLELHVASLV